MEPSKFEETLLISAIWSIMQCSSLACEDGEASGSPGNGVRHLRYREAQARVKQHVPSGVGNRLHGLKCSQIIVFCLILKFKKPNKQIVSVMIGTAYIWTTKFMLRQEYPSPCQFISMMLRLKVEREMGDNVLQNFYPNHDDYLHIQQKFVTRFKICLCVQQSLGHDNYKKNNQ